MAWFWWTMGDFCKPETPPLSVAARDSVFNMLRSEPCGRRPWNTDGGSDDDSSPVRRANPLSPFFRPGRFESRSIPLEDGLSPVLNLSVHACLSPDFRCRI